MHCRVQTCLLLLFILFFETIQSSKIRSVLVTGANRGMGLEWVRQFSQLDNPPDVIFATYRNKSTLQELNKIKESSTKSKVVLIKLDIRYLGQIEAAKKKIEKVVGNRGLNLLINNAGVVQRLNFPNMTYDNMEYHFSTNTVGSIIVTQTMLPLLQAAAKHSDMDGKSVYKAAVISISSPIGSIQLTGVEYNYFLNGSSYKISKAGLNMGMRVIASLVSDDAILVVNIGPGWTSTDMGGPNATFLPSQMVGYMLKTILMLDESYQGGFIKYSGERLPF